MSWSACKCRVRRMCRKALKGAGAMADAAGARPGGARRVGTPMYFPNTFQRSSRIDRRKQRVNSRHKISFRIRVIYLFLF